MLMKSTKAIRTSAAAQAWVCASGLGDSEDWKMKTGIEASASHGFGEHALPEDRGDEDERRRLPRHAGHGEQRAGEHAAERRWGRQSTGSCASELMPSA